jgi:hypothetical protein
MSTIYSRCYALYKEKEIGYIPEHSQMMQIGLTVIKKFKDQNKGNGPRKVQAPEFVGDFKIAVYPGSFTPEIDSSIKDFVSGKKLKNSTKIKQHA